MSVGLEFDGLAERMGMVDMDELGSMLDQWTEWTRTTDDARVRLVEAASTAFDLAFRDHGEDATAITLAVE